MRGTAASHIAVQVASRQHRFDSAPGNVSNPAFVTIE